MTENSTKIQNNFILYHNQKSLIYNKGYNLMERILEKSIQNKLLQMEKKLTDL